MSDEASLTKVTPIICGPALTEMRAFRSLSATVSSPLGDFCTVKCFHRIAVHEHEQLVWTAFAQSGNDVLQVPGEEDLNVIFAVLREGEAGHHAAASADRHSGQLIFLGEIRSGVEGFTERARPRSLRRGG